MSGDAIETIHLRVEVQANGIIRREDGVILGRCSSDREGEENHFPRLKSLESGGAEGGGEITADELQDIIEPIIAKRVEHHSAQDVECPVCFSGREAAEAVSEFLARRLTQAPQVPVSIGIWTQIKQELIFWQQNAPTQEDRFRIDVLIDSIRLPSPAKIDAPGVMSDDQAKDWFEAWFADFQKGKKLYGTTHKELLYTGFMVRHALQLPSPTGQTGNAGKYFHVQLDWSQTEKEEILVLANTKQEAIDLVKARWERPETGPKYINCYYELHPFNLQSPHPHEPSGLDGVGEGRSILASELPEDFYRAPFYRDALSAFTDLFDVLDDDGKKCECDSDDYPGNPDPVRLTRCVFCDARTALAALKSKPSGGEGGGFDV